jgi:hypothetical protein
MVASHWWAMERKMEMIRALAAELRTPELPRINTLLLDQYLRRIPRHHNELSRTDFLIST